MPRNLRIPSQSVHLHDIMTECNLGQTDFGGEKKARAVDRVGIGMPFLLRQTKDKAEA